MVFRGKPSAGCESCRKAKKRCDQKLPSCSRCIRLGKTCVGYRDVSDLMFKNETANVTRRASAHGDPQVSAASSSSAREKTPELVVEGKTFFFDQFVTAAHLAFIKDVGPLDEFLLKPIMACALMAMANRDNDENGRKMARQHYVEAITGTNAALRQTRRVKEDRTLVSVALLSMFERLSWENEGPSANSWRNHVEGAAQVLQLRGRSQIEQTTGAAIFRELRDNIILNALMNETEVSEHVVEWTRALEYDPVQSVADQLSILSSRTAYLRASYKAGSKTNEELGELCDILEKDLLAWSENTLAAGSVCSFHNVHDPSSPHTWNGIRHEYAIPEAHRYWNMWRCLRIILSRLREAIWRRSTSTLTRPSHRFLNVEHSTTAKLESGNDICIAAAYAFGNDTTIDPPRGAVSSGYLMVMPLFLAGSCLVEQLAEPIVTLDGSVIILVHEPLHLNLFSERAVQLAWIIERLDYIASRIGIRWAGQMSSILKGESKTYYDLGSSRVFRDNEMESELQWDRLDFDNLVHFSNIEDP